ncbi:MAG: DUF4255 domain-containing protein [Saprospiraceae bacterium]|nr:DUF4255 domain-containing protein [Saprospiraceae bacterium]
MIDLSLLILQKELNNYLKTSVVLDNIAFIDSTDNSERLRDNVIITLVNTEEESTMKNGLYYHRNAIGGIDYENPPIFLNIYIVLAVNFPTNYGTVALKHLSNIVKFFQGKNTFYFSDEEGNEAQMTLDLYTMTFEQINHLWGSLGGKQIPFVMYKVRLLRLTDHRRLATGSIIIEIEGSVSPNNM